MVTVASLGECCCLLACVVNALRTCEERIAWVGGRARAICPTGFFREVCGPPDNGYIGKDVRKYLDRLVQEGLLRAKTPSYIFRKLEGYKVHDARAYAFHASRIFTDLKPGVMVLFFAFSIPNAYIEPLRNILLSKKAYYMKTNYPARNIHRQLEIFSEKETMRSGNLYYELKIHFVDIEPTPHVCAVCKEENGVVYKYDNANRDKRTRMDGMEDLLPYIFYFTKAYALKLFLPDP